MKFKSIRILPEAGRKYTFICRTLLSGPLQKRIQPQTMAIKIGYQSSTQRRNLNQFIIHLSRKVTEILHNYIVYCKRDRKHIFCSTFNLKGLLSSVFIKKIKSVAIGPQGSYTAQLDFCKWLADDSTTR